MVGLNKVLVLLLDFFFPSSSHDLKERVFGSPCGTLMVGGEGVLHHEKQVSAVVSGKVRRPQESWTCRSVRVNKTCGLEGRGGRVASSFLLHLTHSAVKCGQPGPKGDVTKQKGSFFIPFPRPEPVWRSGTQ